MQSGLRVGGFSVLLAVTIAVGMFGLARSQPEAEMPIEHPAPQASVDAALDRASAALRARDAAAWSRALPAQTAAQEQSWLEVYTRLARFDWRRLKTRSIALGPEDDAPAGRYVVQFGGRLAREELHVLAQRTLDLSLRDGRVTIIADRTPEERRDDRFLAFNDPVVVTTDHLVIVGDRWQRRRISLIAACDDQAPEVVRRLELGGKELARPTLVIVTGSDLQADQAAGAPDDSSVAGFELNGIVYLIGSSVGTHREVAAELLRHELAHAYTESACAGDHPPAALVEGLGVVGEDNLDFADLRGELACGNQTLPLKKALTLQLDWKGLNDDQIGLGYLEGASLVLFIDKYWGMARLYSLIDELQGAPQLDEATVAEACKKVLGITWSQLYERWRQFVQTLP